MIDSNSKLVVNEVFTLSHNWQWDLVNENKYTEKITTELETVYAWATPFACPLEIYTERVVGSSEGEDILDTIDVSKECESNGWYAPVW